MNNFRLLLFLLPSRITSRAYGSFAPKAGIQIVGNSLNPHKLLKHAQALMKIYLCGSVKILRLGDVSELDNGLSPVRHQTITQINADLLSNEPVEINFSEIWFKTWKILLMKMQSKKSSAKFRPSWSSSNVLTSHQTIKTEISVALFNSSLRGIAATPENEVTIVKTNLVPKLATPCLRELNLMGH